MVSLRTLNLIEGWFSFSEGFLLYSLAKNSLGRGEIVEIGSWKGKSTAFLAKGIKDGKKRVKITAIDPHEGTLFSDKKKKKDLPTFIDFKNNLKKHNLLSYVHPLIATSQNAVKKWKKSIEVLFIDGLHDYKNTYSDFSSWFPFVIPDGSIVFHDAFCGHVGPERLIRENVLDSNIYSDIGVIGSIVYIKKGRVKNILQLLNKKRHQALLPLAAYLNKSSMPHFVRFFLIHRVIKLFLLNYYTIQLLFHTYEAK